MAKSAKGELEPGGQGDLPIIDPPKPPGSKPSVGDAVRDEIQAQLAALPVHDGDVPRVNHLIHELQQLTDLGSLYAVKVAAERHLVTVLTLKKAAKDADEAAAEEAKAAALKAHRAEQAAEKRAEKDEKDAA